MTEQTAKQTGQPSKPQKKVYDENHHCPIKEARLARLKGRPRSAFRKWFSRLVWVFIGIPIVLLLGFVAAVSLIDFNQYKPQIEAEFQQRLGYELEIKGAIAVSPLPFSLQVHQIVVKNAKGFSRENLAQIKSMRANVSLPSLFFQRRLDFLGVEFDSPELFLEVLPTGQTNWQPLKQKLLHAVRLSPNDQSGFIKASDQATLVAPTETATATETEPSAFSWRLDSLIWQNSHVEWVNQQHLTQWTLDKFDLMAFDLAPGQPFKILSNFDLTTSWMAADASVHLTTWLTLDAALSKWQLTDWVGNTRLMLPVTAGIPETRIEMAGHSAEWSSKTNQFHVKQAKLSSLESTLTADFSGSYQSNHLVHQGKIVANQINLRHWFRHAGVPLPNFVDDKALTDFSIAFDWSQSADQFNIEQLALQLDQSLLQGSIWRKAPSQKDTPPQLQFDLTLAGLDLETYRAKMPVSVESSTPSKDTTTETTKATTAAETYLPIGLPIATLQALNAQGQLHAKNITLWQMKIDALEATLTAKQGRIDLAPFDANLYGGELRSKLQVDVTGQTPAYRGSAKLMDLDLLPFLSAAWQMRQLQGRLNGHFDFSTQGVNGHLLTQNLAGTLTADIRNGALKGLDLNKLLAAQATKPSDKTAFSQLKLKSHLQQGQLIVDRLNLNSERFSAIGTGKLALLKGVFNGKLFTTYHQPPESLASFKGLEIPVQVKGPVDKLLWTIELEKLMNNPSNQQKLFESLKNFIGRTAD